MKPRCTLGVGCDEVGACYAAAQGSPSECSRPAHCLSPRWPWNAYVTAAGMELRNEATGERLHTFGEAALRLNALEEQLRNSRDEA